MNVPLGLVLVGLNLWGAGAGGAELGAPPTVFDEVWYRPEKLGFSLKSYSSSGKLTVGTDALSFESSKETLRVPYAQTRSVSVKNTSPRTPGGEPLQWAVVEYAAEDGAQQTVGFRAGTGKQARSDTSAIYDTIRQAVDRYREAAVLGEVSSLGPVERVRFFAERMEAAEAGRDPGVSLARLHEEMEKGGQALEAHLATHPDDVSALILSARLDRAREMQTPVVVGGAGATEQLAQAESDARTRLAARQALLDRALALQPDSAEACYWKARLYGVEFPTVQDGKTASAFMDLDQAIHFARKAVELAPENVAYREALAIYFCDKQQYDQAAAVMKPVGSGRHPMSVLLGDLKAFPIPERAVFQAGHSEALAQLQMESGSIKDYPFLRLKVYAVAAPAAEVESIYRRRWPEFKLFEMDHEEGTRTFLQFLRWEGSELHAASSKRQVPDSPGEGLSLMVSEFRKPQGEAWETPEGIQGDVFCILMIVNGRTIGSLP